MHIQNTLPRDITLIKADGRTHTLTASKMPIIYNDYAVINLPKQKEGIIYLVSKIVFKAFAYRGDFIVIDGSKTVRDKDTLNIIAEGGYLDRKGNEGSWNF